MISRLPLAASVRRRALATVSTSVASISVPEHITTLPSLKPAQDEEELQSSWVRLSGLPRAVAPADLYRHAASLGLVDLQNAHLDYKNFIPTGRGWLRFGKAEHAARAVKMLQSSRLAAHPLRARITKEIDIIRAGQPFRARGEKGRVEATERGLLTGNGPDARVKERGTSVYLWGLPGTTYSHDLARVLEPYGLRVTAEDEYPVRQIHRKTPTARFLVRLSTTSGAHRLVRDFHMTERFGPGYTVRAQVIY
ncbi:hypothetical protein RhiJN_28306 [Ceratobasidium sp. AG-Ba]|nr:hypothetical protein RhiJN_28306 [Ceratobasidium sp. AG-Ba]